MDKPLFTTHFCGIVSEILLWYKALFVYKLCAFGQSAFCSGNSKRNAAKGKIRIICLFPSVGFKCNATFMFVILCMPKVKDLLLSKKQCTLACF